MYTKLIKPKVLLPQTRVTIANLGYYGEALWLSCFLSKTWSSNLLTLGIPDLCFSYAIKSWKTFYIFKIRNHNLYWHISLLVRGSCFVYISVSLSVSTLFFMFCLQQILVGRGNNSVFYISIFYFFLNVMLWRRYFWCGHIYFWTSICQIFI